MSEPMTQGTTVTSNESIASIMSEPMTQPGTTVTSNEPIDIVPQMLFETVDDVTTTPDRPTSTAMPTTPKKVRPALFLSS